MIRTVWIGFDQNAKIYNQRFCKTSDEKKIQLSFQHNSYVI